MRDPSNKKSFPCAHGKYEWWALSTLVLVILYMDGISLDAHGRLGLTLLNSFEGIRDQKNRVFGYTRN